MLPKLKNINPLTNIQRTELKSVCNRDNNYYYYYHRCAKVVPVVIGALGSVTKDLECWIEKMDIVPEVGVLQKTALLGTARTLRKVLEL